MVLVRFSKANRSERRTSADFGSFRRRQNQLEKNKTNSVGAAVEELGKKETSTTKITPDLFYCENQKDLVMKMKKVNEALGNSEYSPDAQMDRQFVIKVLKKERKLVDAIGVTHFLTILLCAALYWSSWNPETEKIYHPQSAENLIILIFICSIVSFVLTFQFRLQKKGHLGQFTTVTWMEVFVALICVPPGTQSLGIPNLQWISICNVVIFFRMYWILELLRVRSDIRNDIDLHIVYYIKGDDVRAGERSITNMIPTDIFVRQLLLTDPFRGSLTLCVMLLTWGSLVLLWTEMEDSPDYDFRHWFYFLCIVFTSVGLGDIKPLNHLGRSLTIVTSFAGIMFVTCCVGFLFSAIELSEHDEKIRQKMIQRNHERQLRTCAARAIQAWYRGRKGYNTKQASTISGLYSFGKIKKGEDEHNEGFLKQKDDLENTVQDKLTSSLELLIMHNAHAINTLVQGCQGIIALVTKGLK